MGLLQQDALAGSVAAGVTAAAYALPEHAERAVNALAWGRAPLVPFEVPLSGLAGFPLTVSTVPEAVGFTAAISAAVVCYQFRHPGTGAKAAGSTPMDYGMKTFMQSLGVLPRSLTDFLPFKYFWGSLNCVYALIAAVTYYFANPSLERCATFELDWMGFVLARNLFLMFFYYEAFYTALYRFGVAKKKFNEKFVSAEEHRSNIFWCVMGTIQWSVWEIIFMHLWGSGKLPYIKDADFFTPAMLLRTIGWTLAIPLWREFHFYWIHRLIHVRVLYKYVHYLHHKAHNPEPYAGIRMHPIEHLFCKTRPLSSSLSSSFVYACAVSLTEGALPSDYSCAALPLYFLQSPFHFMFNIQHAALSPAQSHTGFEDHTGGDQFHYLHHAKFECNCERGNAFSLQ